MEVIIAQRVTPIVKCMVLFLLIFTAKVLTSRPQEQPDSKNSIQFGKTPHYVRTFTKYHHRRTGQWEGSNPNYWQATKEHEKPIGKRSVDENEFVHDSLADPFQDYTSEGHRDNAIGSVSKKNPESSKDMMNLLTNDVKKQKVKPNADGMITCLYKIHKVAYSVTPSYEEDSNAQMMVENESFEAPGSISDLVWNGERVQVEHCSRRGATCYTLWHRSDSGNTTVLGQGCWRQSPQRSGSGCDKCVQATPLLPATKFCCCTTDYCNADFLSIKDEVVTPKAESTVRTASSISQYNIVSACVLALMFVLLLVVAAKRVYCLKLEEISEDHEKGEVMGSGPDALATGLLCVDNLTLIEHIGVGKFGTVWRGSLGARPVAVKLYSSAAARHREAAIYTMPLLAHPNILKYYGSDSRPCLTGAGGRQHLTVLELCRGTLRSRLQLSSLTWQEFARLAHGVASALSHLHSSTPTKPVMVHRDVNSNNVLISLGGDARLADLGLAQALRSPNPAKLTEAGTLRYLAPEALEGAIDLSRARAALCAVDVFALGLVLWEMVWRCSGAHAETPPYAAPYQHCGLPARPSHRQMQQLVSRDKARPPLPRGPSCEPRALRLAADTCDECWDHDAEARLTAVCVQERMSELRQMFSAAGPVTRDNNLRPQLPEPAPPAAPAPRSCADRNTHRQHAQEAETLIHRSLKDVASPPPLEGPRTRNAEEICLSVARDSRHRATDNSNMNEIRSYPKPLEYVPNDMSVEEIIRMKQTNLMQEKAKTKWGFRKFFEKKLSWPQKLETEVTLIQENLSNGSADSGRIRTSIVNEKPLNFSRPSNIAVDQDGRTLYSLEAPCLSPPNRTLSPTMIMESDMNRENNVFGFKEMPLREDNERQNQIFAVIVPKAKPGEYKRNLIEMRSKTSRGSSESLNKNSVVTSVSSQSIFNTGHSESEDSTVKKRLSCDNKICNASSSARSSRASINLELQYIDPNDTFNDSPYELNSDCSSSEDEHLMLLSENDGSKITMQTVTKADNTRKHNEVLKEATQTKTADFSFNKSHNKYANFDNEFSDPHDKENVNGYSVDNPVYIAALNGEISTDLKTVAAQNSEPTELPKSPKPSLKSLTIKRQHSLEQVSEIFTSSSDIALQNPAGRVKTPGDLPVAVRKARRDRALQRGRVDSNRLSLYDDRMMFGNSL